MTVMSERHLNGIRWLALLPCALLTTLIVRIGAEAVFRYALVVMAGLESWTPWVVNGVASLLMAAVFVFSVRFIAPSAKTMMSALALAAIVVWAAAQIIGAPESGSLNVPVAMAIGGLIGGALAFGLIRLSETRQPH
jgi:membrane associated rhomboid family serine protease